jgi:glycosyltransferase involved in cell wall biosynthesis
VRSGIGDYTRHLLPYLREFCEVRVFVEANPGEGEELAARLDPEEHDHILYQLGNELLHSFMPAMIRRLGGTVMQHDWILFDMALRAFPGLERGGVKGHALAMREGGVEEIKIYARNWFDRRAQRKAPVSDPAPEVLDDLLGCFLFGWYPAEEKGRWSGDKGILRIPARGVCEVAVTASADPGRTIGLIKAGKVIAKLECTSGASWGRFSAEFDAADEPIVAIGTHPVVVTQEQRQHGDTRRLGAFVEKIEWRDADGWHEVDMSLPTAVPCAPVSLSRDRFRLSLNRSVVRFADSFITHSNYVKHRILTERNATTPIGVLHHGAEKRWHEDESRADTRKRLGLPEEWWDDFLLVSFGGVQPHKRIDKVYAGVARAREKHKNVRLVMAGGWTGEGVTPNDLAQAHGLEGAVHLTGYLPEKEAWDWIHAGNASINLRGPTSGGTSGGIFQSLGLGRTLIATDAAEQAELPDSCIMKVPLGRGEVEAIGDTLIELLENPKRCQELESAVRSFVEEECHWRVVAKQYFEYLERMPPPRGKKKQSVIARVKHEIAARKAEQA